MSRESKVGSGWLFGESMGRSVGLEEFSEAVGCWGFSEVAGSLDEADDGGGVWFRGEFCKMGASVPPVLVWFPPSADPPSFITLF